MPWSSSVSHTRLITRAALGIGRVSAEITASLGAQLALADINVKELAKTNEIWSGLQFEQNPRTYNITRAGILHLQPGSSIVNVTSLGPKQIRDNAVAPSYISTATNAGVLAEPEAVAKQVEEIAMGRIGTAGEIAHVVAFSPAREEARYTSGSVVEISGGRT
ncbi:NAD(P)-binding protein [Teratosphaeria nubilosa]|uniref:NAD(P)-binding protein n=1 Tax=Teratosphaeria nubilosa TaxID=161662 RepID=A0A6G1KXM6_9PEZI|nr:NAD(P)-binding protein [Teratosphaeria nubilosa]